MLYGRLWHNSRGNFWSVRFKSKKVYEEALKCLEETKREHGTFSWSQWHLEPLRLSELSHDLRAIVKDGRAPWCETGVDVINYINRIHAFWDSYRTTR